MATNTKIIKYVVDSSVIIAYLMEDEQNTPQHAELINLHNHKQITFHAPSILPFEIGNALKSATLSKRISIVKAKSLYLAYFGLEITLLPISHRQTFTLSCTHNMSYYDASYLSLARKLHYPLLTLDKKLVNLCKGQ